MEKYNLKKRDSKNQNNLMEEKFSILSELGVHVCIKNYVRDACRLSLLFTLLLLLLDA